MKTIAFILLGILLINTSFKNTPQTFSAKVYDYVTLVVQHANSDKPKTVSISYNGGKYEQKDIKDKAQGAYDNNEIFKLINEYEREGYELYANNFTPQSNGNYTFNYFLLRREHKN